MARRVTSLRQKFGNASHWRDVVMFALFSSLFPVSPLACGVGVLALRQGWEHLLFAKRPDVSN